MVTASARILQMDNVSMMNRFPGAEQLMFSQLGKITPVRILVT